MLSNGKQTSQIGYDMHRCSVCGGHSFKRTMGKIRRAREKRQWRAEETA